MKIIKRVIDDDPIRAMQIISEWFYAQDKYEEGDMVATIRPNKATEVQFVTEEA